MSGENDSDVVEAWDDAGAWISAAETIRLVRTETLSPTANITIATRAHAGMLRARADLMVINQNQRHPDIEVPGKFWWADGGPALSQDWEVGDFDTWFDHKVRYQIFGVRFLRADVQRMIPGAKALRSDVSQGASREAGGRPMSALWPEWVAELVAYIHEVGIPEGVGSAGADDLVATVGNRLAERGLDAPARTTVLATAKAVLRRLRNDGN